MKVESNQAQMEVHHKKHKHAQCESRVLGHPVDMGHKGDIEKQQQQLKPPNQLQASYNRRHICN